MDVFYSVERGPPARFASFPEKQSSLIGSRAGQRPACRNERFACYIAIMPAINADTVPYPPGPDPDAIPDGLTATHRSYRVQEMLLLSSQLLFLSIYVSLIVLSIGI